MILQESDLHLTYTCVRLRVCVRLRLSLSLCVCDRLLV